MAPILFHGLSQLGLPVVCVESRQAYQPLKSLATRPLLVAFRRLHSWHPLPTLMASCRPDETRPSCSISGRSSYDSSNALGR
jgi:hypothetical protein